MVSIVEMNPIHEFTARKARLNKSTIVLIFLDIPRLSSDFEVVRVKRACVSILRRRSLHHCQRLGDFLRVAGGVGSDKSAEAVDERAEAVQLNVVDNETETRAAYASFTILTPETVRRFVENAMPIRVIGLPEARKRSV